MYNEYTPEIISELKENELYSAVTWMAIMQVALHVSQFMRRTNGWILSAIGQTEMRRTIERQLNVAKELFQNKDHS